jgi:hypothetical protein
MSIFINAIPCGVCITFQIKVICLCNLKMYFTLKITEEYFCVFRDKGLLHGNVLKNICIFFFLFFVQGSSNGVFLMHFLKIIFQLKEN